MTKSEQRITKSQKQRQATNPHAAFLPKPRPIQCRGNAVSTRKFVKITFSFTRSEHENDCF